MAEGNFSLRLDPRRVSPLAAAYEDFNKMAEELQGVQTLREDFINSFSHEFKTPITAVSGFAELLQEPGLTEEERSQYLQIIAEEAHRLANLANSTLLMSRLESQHSIPEKEPFPWMSRSSAAPSCSPAPGRKSASPSPLIWSPSPMWETRN